MSDLINKKSRICTIMKTDREIIQDLAGGFTVRDEIDGWDSELFMQPPGRYSVTHNQIQSLIDGGWLRTFPNGSGYRLSDEGLKAHNRAMDELGDGKLIAPNTSNLPQTTTNTKRRPEGHRAAMQEYDILGHMELHGE